MPRRPASERFDDVTPPASWPPTGEALADAIRALSHPSRRELLDVLTGQGPASVGQLSRRTGLAVGSVSHHTRVLAQAGFIEPATDMAGDTRESWWRAVPRGLSWGPADFTPGSAGAELAQLAGRANLDYLMAAMKAWAARQGQDPWRGTVTDTLVSATREEMDDLGRRMSDLIAEWGSECRDHAHAAPEGRRPVRALSAVFPEARHD